MTLPPMPIVGGHACPPPFDFDFRLKDPEGTAIQKSGGQACPAHTSSHMRGCPTLCLNIRMDLIAHLTRLFEYDAWANREGLSNLRGLPAATAPVKTDGPHSCVAAPVDVPASNPGIRHFQYGPTSQWKNAKSMRENCTPCGRTI